jgi:polyketide synthase 7
VARAVPGTADTVVHLPAGAELAPLAELTPERLAEQVGRAARDAAAAAAADPATLVLFSSVTAVWGSRDHGAYAAAAAHLDALARQRDAAGHRTVALGWPLWDLGTDELREPAERARRQGLTPLDPARAAVALDRALAGGPAHLVVADVAWDRFAPLLTAARPNRLLDAVAGESTVEDEAPLRRELAGLAPAEREARLLGLVRGHAAAVLRHASADTVPVHRPFKDLGFDSMAAVELRNRLRAGTGLAVPATAVFDHPTPAALAGYLLGELVPAGAVEDPVLAHLDALEAAVTERPELVAKLEALLRRVAPAGEDADLSGASADDMFALLDRELSA